jgi:hypothetical protein
MVEPLREICPRGVIPELTTPYSVERGISSDAGPVAFGG